MPDESRRRFFKSAFGVAAGAAVIADVVAKPSPDQNATPAIIPSRIPSLDELDAWRLRVKMQRERENQGNIVAKYYGDDENGHELVSELRPLTPEEVLSRREIARNNAIALGDGFASAREGIRNTACPYDDGSNAFYAWHTGWNQANRI